MVDKYQSAHFIDYNNPPWQYLGLMIGSIGMMVAWRVILYQTHRSLQKRPLQSRHPLSSRERLFYHSVFAFQALQTKYFHRPAICRIAGYNLFGSLDWAEVMFTLLLYIGNVILIITSIHYDPIKTLTGTLREKVCLLSSRCIIIHMPLLFATAGRCSILSSLVGVSYRAMNFAHRAIGRMCFAAAIVHLITSVSAMQLLFGPKTTSFILTQPFTQYSIVAFACITVSALMSTLWIRTHKFDLFLVTHVIAAATLIPMVYFHKTATIKWVGLSAAIWSIDRMNRWVGLFLNHVLAPFCVRSCGHASVGTITASIEYLDGALVLRIPMHFTWTAGQHIYISFWSKKMLSRPWLFGRWHPFTLTNLALDCYSKDLDIPASRTAINQVWMGCCVVQIRHGTTKWLHENAGSHIQVLVDGPYGGHDLWSAAHSTLVMVAGGAGITYVLGVLEGLAASARRNQGGNLKRIEIYWILKNEAQLAWVEPRVSQICVTLESHNLVLSAHAYLTKKSRILSSMHMKGLNRPIPIALKLTPMGNSDYLKMERDARIASLPPAKSTVSMVMQKSLFSLITGRPNLDQVFSEICDRSQGTVVIHVCGPRSLSDAVKLSAANCCSPREAWNGKLSKCITIHHELFNTT